MHGLFTTTLDKLIILEHYLQLLSFCIIIITIPFSFHWACPKDYQKTHCGIISRSISPNFSNETISETRCAFRTNENLQLRVRYLSHQSHLKLSINLFQVVWWCRKDSVTALWFKNLTGSKVTERRSGRWYWEECQTEIQVLFFSSAFRKGRQLWLIGAKH